MDSNHSWAGLPLSGRKLNLATLFVRGFFALLLTIAGSLWVGHLIAKSSRDLQGASAHLKAIKQLKEIERQILEERGPLRRRARQVQARINQPFRLCPAQRGRVLKVFNEHGTELVSFPSRKGRILRLHLPKRAHKRGKKSGAKALCMPLKQHKRSGVFTSIIFGVIGIIGGLAWLLLPLLKRLRAMESVVQRLANGDYQARVHDRGDDAVGQLATGVDQIGQRVEELLAAQRHLHASVSHELRTPLARLAAAVDLAEDHPNPKLFEGMRADIHELDGMVEELLTLARLQDPHARNVHAEVDLVALTKQRIEAAKRGETTAIEWIVDLPAVATCPGDLRLLARLLDNLLTNALRHTESVIAISLTQHTNSWVLSVADNGPGIHPDQMEFVFTPFVSGTHGGSAGLGLAICREISDRHNGELSVKTSQYGGAEFQLVLPA